MLGQNKSKTTRLPTSLTMPEINVAAVEINVAAIASVASTLNINIAIELLIIYSTPEFKVRYF